MCVRPGVNIRQEEEMEQRRGRNGSVMDVTWTGRCLVTKRNVRLEVGEEDAKHELEQQLVRPS